MDRPLLPLGPWSAEVLEEVGTPESGILTRWCVRTDRDEDLVQATICDIPDWPSHVAEAVAQNIEFLPVMWEWVDRIHEYLADPGAIPETALGLVRGLYLDFEEGGWKDNG